MWRWGGSPSKMLEGPPHDVARIQAAASVPASAEGRVTVPLPDVPAIRGEPMSLVLLLRNEASEPRTLFGRQTAMSVDGRKIGDIVEILPLV